MKCAVEGRGPRFDLRNAVGGFFLYNVMLRSGAVVRRYFRLRRAETYVGGVLNTWWALDKLWHMRGTRNAFFQQPHFFSSESRVYFSSMAMSVVVVTLWLRVAHHCLTEQVLV